LRAGTLLENLSRDPAAAYYADLAFLKPHEARRLLGLRTERDPALSPVYAAVTEPYRQCPSASAVQRAEYADLKVYMPNDPLVKVDRMSMAHSLEVRSPLLDRKVVELAFRIPADRKQVGREGKALLRRLAERRLPAGQAALPKRGFTVPIGDWIRGPHSDMFRDEVLRPNAAVASSLDLGDLRRRFEEHRRGTANQSYALWAVWVLERWLNEVNVSADRVASPGAAGAA
jgi:asparagine synthase (glutamine-hydrolysing)